MRVLAYCPQPLDGTAYWRVAAPLSLLRSRAEDFNYSIVDRVDTNAILACDVLLLQRPMLDEHVGAMETAKILGRKVWCDWDDDIFNVPANNKGVFVYGRDEFKDNARRLSRGADAITVTCEALAKTFRLAAMNRDAPVVVVPNALDPTLTVRPTTRNQLPVRRIAWRGGDSHNEDLRAHGAAMARVAQRHEGAALWHFLGFNPHWLLREFPSESMTVHQWIGDPVTYLRFLCELAPSILAVPLVDDAFNRSKSNISVLEASWVGAVPVAPDFVEGCALPGVFTYGASRSFAEALEAAASATDDELAERLVALRAAVARHYDLDQANLLRALLLKRLTKGPENAAAPAEQ